MRQDFVELGRQNYQECIEIISYVVDYVKKASAGVYTPEKQKEFLANFYVNYDFLLVLSLFKIAVADGQLEKEELIYIRKMVDYADFCKICREKFHIQIDWVDLYDEPCKKVAKLVNEITESSMKMLEEFTKYCSVYFLSHRNDFDDLMSNSFSILDSLSAADGEYSEEEMQKKYETVLYTFKQHVEMYMSKFKKH